MTFGIVCDAIGSRHRVGQDWACCTCGFTVPLGERYLFPHLLKTDAERERAQAVKESVAAALAELLSTQ